MDSVYIVMPCYNEEETIEKVIVEWYKVLDGKSDDSRLIIADGGSKDRTHEILIKLKNGEYEKIEILDTSNQYHGPKLIALYDYAIKKNIDFIFQTDSDGQTNPNEFDAFWQMRSQFSCILGNRTIRGDGRLRALVERVVCLLLKLYFHIDVPDANAPFRLMKTSVVEKYLHRLPVDYNIPNIMLTAYFAHFNENIVFKEITFKPRQGGINSINIAKIFKIGWKALKDFSGFRRELEKESI